MFRRKTIQDAKQESEKIYESLTAITCCFTGHRPQKLPWGFKESGLRYALTKEDTTQAIEEAIKNGKKHFITGMALGFDMMCAEIVLTFKRKYPDITLECAIPCKGQEKVWHKDQQIRYHNILKQADKVRCVFDHYVDGCMQERNKYMVESSSLIIALFDGNVGGTKQTIEYAKKQGKQVVIVKPRTDKELSDKDLEQLIRRYFENQEPTKKEFEKSKQEVWDRIQEKIKEK